MGEESRDGQCLVWVGLPTCSLPGAAAAPATSEVVPTPSVQGWVFNVVPWLVAIPASVLSGFLSDHLISQGESWGQGWAGGHAQASPHFGKQGGSPPGGVTTATGRGHAPESRSPALQSQPEVYLWEPGSWPDSASCSPSLSFPVKGGVGAQRELPESCCGCGVSPEGWTRPPIFLRGRKGTWWGQRLHPGASLGPRRTHPRDCDPTDTHTPTLHPSARL